MENVSKEELAIFGAKQPTTLRDLVGGMHNVGVARGATVLVHSSLSRLGWVVGGAQTVLEALRAAVGPDGTLVMPGFSGGHSDPAKWQAPPVPEAWVETVRANMPLFDRATTPTRGLGVVVEGFRSLPGTQRSYHPVDSFLAAGPNADALLADHPIPDGLGPEGPLGRLYDADAHVLMLATDWNTCTCFHLAEYHPKVPREEELLPVERANGVTRWTPYQNTSLNSPYFAKFGPAMEASGMVAHNDAPKMRGFKLRDAVDVARNVIDRDA